MLAGACGCWRGSKLSPLLWCSRWIFRPAGKRVFWWIHAPAWRQRPAAYLLPCPQGDGTAHIFDGRSDVFTLSVHAAANFPARKQRSQLDIGLPDGTGDAEFLK